MTQDVSVHGRGFGRVPRGLRRRVGRAARLVGEAVINAFTHDGRVNRVLTWMSHQVIRLWVIAVVLYAGTWFGLAEVFTASADGALYVAFVVFLLHGLLRRSCPQCRRAIPGDARLRAQQQRRRLVLRLAHLTTSRWALPVLIGLSIIDLVLIKTQYLGPHAGDCASKLFSLAAVYATVFHTRVQPWCPYCATDPTAHDRIAGPFRLRLRRTAPAGRSPA